MALSNLDLTNDEIQSGRILKPGLYRVISKDAKYESKDAAREAVVVTFEDTGGLGQINNYFNYKHPNEDATRIGRSQLKTFLTHGKHPDPNRPGDVHSMNGLTLLIHVVEKGTYMKDGKALPNYEIAQFSPDRPDAKVGPHATGSSAGGGAPLNGAGGGARTMDDEIPF